MIRYGEDYSYDIFHVIIYWSLKQFFNPWNCCYSFVFDTVGGDTYRRSFKVLKKGGSSIIIVSMLEQDKRSEIEITYF